MRKEPSVWPSVSVPRWPTTAIAYDKHSIHISVSVSFAVAEVDVPVDFDTMYKTAAGAIKDAKDHGRNCFEVRRVPTQIS